MRICCAEVPSDLAWNTRVIRPVRIRDAIAVRRGRLVARCAGLGGDRAASVVGEEVQCLCHEQFVVLEEGAVAGVGVDAQLGVGEQLGEVE